jgi:nucleoside-triphosphatase THEP1
MFMRESGFSWVETLLGQRELVGAVAHIARQVTSAPQIKRYAVSVERNRRWQRTASPSVKRAIEQTPIVSAARVPA